MSVLNVYVPSNRASKYLREKTYRTAKRNGQLTIDRGFQYPSLNNVQGKGTRIQKSSLYETSTQKVSKNLEDLNNKINQLNH